jgi:hypothetical protein
VKIDLSTSLYRGLLRALDPSIVALKGGPGSGAKPGPDQSRAADEAWDVRGRKGEEGSEGRKRPATPDEPKGKRKKDEESKTPPLLDLEEIVSRAEALAERAHAGQTRGHGKEDVPYIEHPREIAGRLIIEEQEPEVIAAAFLHDAVEDTADSDNPLTFEEIAEQTTPRVAALVESLTDVYTKKNFPDLNRKERKQRYRQHLRKAPREAKMIKLLDRISNLNDMKGADPKFQRLYARESELLLDEALEGTDDKLEQELKDAIGQVQRWSMGEEQAEPEASTEPGETPRQKKHPQKSVISSSKTLKQSVENPSAVVKEVKRLAQHKRGRAQTYRVDFKDGTMGIYKPTHGTGLEMGFDRPPRPIGKKSIKTYRVDDWSAAFKRFKEIRDKYKAYGGPSKNEPKPYPTGPNTYYLMGAYRHLKEGTEQMLKVELHYDKTAGKVVIVAEELDTNEYTEARYTVDKTIHEKYREMATYQISEALGFGVVPQVEFVDYGEGEGHVQAFVEGVDASDAEDEFWEDVEDRSRPGHNDLHRIAALDMIIGNTDRHWGNFRRGGDGRWYAIDNGLAIPNNSHHYEFLSVVIRELMGVEGEEAKIPAEVRREIQALDPEKLERILDDAGFVTEDIKGSLARLAALKKMRKWPSNMRYFDKKKMKYAPSRFMARIKA